VRQATACPDSKVAKVLRVDVDNVDLDNKRMPVCSKGGDTGWCHLDRLGPGLPKLVVGAAVSAVPG
jgi:hypothetical protein